SRAIAGAALSRPQRRGERLGAGVRPREGDRYDRAPGQHERRHQTRLRLCGARHRGHPVAAGNAGAPRRNVPRFCAAAHRGGALFLTGYLYDPKLDGTDGDAMQGSAATHAWADIYLPGAGWVEYDPTNGLIAGENLIRVAVTRDASQAIPVDGTFTGDPESFI